MGEALAVIVLAKQDDALVILFWMAIAIGLLKGLLDKIFE